MKRLIRAILGFILALSAASGGEPWAKLTGLTSAQLGVRVATFANPIHGLQLDQLSGCEDGGNVRYAALWGPRTDAFVRRSFHGLTAAGLVSQNATEQAAGWRIVWLNGFHSGGTDFYNVIYRKSDGVPQVLRLGDSLTAHQDADADLRGSGHYLENLCVFRSGTTVKYGAVWNKALVGPVTQVSYGLTAAQVEAEAASRASTWRIHNLCGYTLPFVTAGSDPLRHTVVWRQPKLENVPAMHLGLGPENHAAADSNETGVGWRPSHLQVWQNGGTVAVNGLWVPNGGLARNYLTSLETLVRSSMSARSIPGFTLAISRNGRLVYKRAYGLADKEAGLLAGTDHRFRVASVSKALAGVAVIHALENQTTWNILSKVFGTGAVFGTDYGTPPYSSREQAISISNLLHHTAGWTDEGKLWHHDEPAWGSSHQEFIDWQLDHGTFVADPGRIGRYSNLGFTIAARVVEKLSGQTFEAYNRSEIFAPCGISTLLGPVIGERTRAERKFMEVAYYPDPEYAGDPYVIDPRRMDGSTGWIARPADLLLLGRRVDGDGAFEDILTRTSVTRLHTRETPDSSTGYDWDRYGCGWYTDDYSDPGFWKHNGSMNGTRAELVLRTDGTAYAWAANARQGVENSSLENILDTVTAANAWPDIDLFGVNHPAYDAWLATRFSAVELAQRGLDEQVFSPVADPDDDDLPNAVEYFLGLDPLAADDSPFQVAPVAGKFRIRWLAKSGTSGASIGFRVSTDLVDWVPLIGVLITEPSGLVAPVGYRWQQLEIPQTGRGRFVRFHFAVH